MVLSRNNGEGTTAVGGDDLDVVGGDVLGIQKKLLPGGQGTAQDRKKGRERRRRVKERW